MLLITFFECNYKFDFFATIIFAYRNNALMKRFLKSLHAFLWFDQKITSLRFQIFDSSFFYRQKQYLKSNFKTYNNIEKHQMPNKSNSLTRHIPESYINISFQTRKKLIELANEKKTSIREICLRLEIKQSTAKSILRKYRKFGKIFRRKSEENTTNFSFQNQQNTNRLSDQSQLPDTEKIAFSIQKPINFQQNRLNSNKELENIFQHYFWIQMPFYMPNFYSPF